MPAMPHAGRAQPWRPRRRLFLAPSLALAVAAALLMLAPLSGGDPVDVLWGLACSFAAGLLARLRGRRRARLPAAALNVAPRH